MGEQQQHSFPRDIQGETQQQQKAMDAPLRFVRETKVTREYMASAASSSSLRLRAICTRMRKGTFLEKETAETGDQHRRRSMISDSAYIGLCRVYYCTVVTYLMPRLHTILLRSASMRTSLVLIIYAG